MSTVGDLIRRTGRDAAIAAIERLYPKKPGPRSGYERVWLELIAMWPTPTSMKCVVALTNPPDSFVDVSGKIEGDPTSYAIEFRPWAEWLGMTVEVKPPLVLTEIETVAHVLWEMTYAGYDEALIQSQHEELRAIAESIRSDERTD
jgi:hypothetical protein